jgi:hypothetical protein
VYKDMENYELEQTVWNVLFLHHAALPSMLLILSGCASWYLQLELILKMSSVFLFSCIYLDPAF